MPNHPGTYIDTITFPIRWSDMDALGHVNSCVYFTYFEQARIEWWKKQNITNFTTTNSGPVLVTANCTYLRPIVYPEDISIKIYVGTPGRSSYECYYDVISANDPTILYAEGQTKLVWVDRTTGKSTPLPDYIIKLIPT
jgi:acyl-CoA thioester hydrolase